MNIGVVLVKKICVNQLKTTCLFFQRSKFSFKNSKPKRCRVELLDLLEPPLYLESELLGIPPLSWVQGDIPPESTSKETNLIVSSA